MRITANAIRNYVNSSGQMGPPPEWRKKCFLKWKTHTEVYVAQSLRYGVMGDQVLKLRKTLYGLKELTREWDAVLFKELEFLGLRRSTFDPIVFTNKNNTLIIAAFVDNLGTCFSDPAEDERVANTSLKPFG